VGTAACGAALAVTLTTTLVGHAADRGDLSPIAMIDWLHVTAAAAWTGGLFVLAAVVLGEARTWPRARVVALMRRFSTLAGGCLMAVVASGIFNACVELGSLDALWTTRYGAILVAKVVLVVTVASFGAANRFAVLPRLTAGTGPSRGADDRLMRYVACEAGLALLVFGCTALLTDSTPPAHHDMGRLAREASRSVSGASASASDHVEFARRGGVDDVQHTPGGQPRGFCGIPRAGNQVASPGTC
jgi:putative copper export protein